MTPHYRLNLGRLRTDPKQNEADGLVGKDRA